MEKVSESGGAWCRAALCEEVADNMCPRKPLRGFEGLVRVKSIWRRFRVLLLSHHALGQLSVFTCKNRPGMPGVGAMRDIPYGGREPLMTREGAVLQLDLTRIRQFRIHLLRY